jgi:hypothetical protein
MMDFLGQVFAHAFGGVIVLVLLSANYKAQAVDWEKLVRVYGRDWLAPRLKKRFAHMMLYSEGRPAKSYNSILDIGLLDDGIALRPSRIFAPFHAPIFIPYTDIEGWSQQWYINAKSAELSFRKAPGMRMIMPRDQVEWMFSLTGLPAPVSAARPPHGKWPSLTFIAALSGGIMAVAVFAFGLVAGLPLTRQDLAREGDAVAERVGVLAVDEAGGWYVWGGGD